MLFSLVLLEGESHIQMLNHSTNKSRTQMGSLAHLPYDSTCTDLSLAFARLQSQANGHLGYDHFDHNDHHLGNNDPNSNHPLTPQGNNHLGFLDAIRGGFLENSTPNGFHNNMLYSGGNIGNGNLMGLNNGSSTNHDEDQEILNHQMFDDHHQDVPQLMNNSNSSCGAATTAVTMTTVKQEACNMMRSSSDQLGMGENRPGVLWGFPWQMGGGGGGDQGNMIHEVESGGGRSQIGGWNGIGSTTWHGLINSPLM